MGSSVLQKSKDGQMERKRDKARGPDLKSSGRLCAAELPLSNRANCAVLIKSELVRLREDDKRGSSETHVLAARRPIAGGQMLHLPSPPGGGDRSHWPV